MSNLSTIKKPVLGKKPCFKARERFRINKKTLTIIHWFDCQASGKIGVCIGEECELFGRNRK